MAATSTARATIPPELLYWGLLDRPAARLDRAGRAFAFERLLPVPVDGLHLAETRLPDGRLAMVGIPADTLRAHLAAREDIHPGIWSLVPAAWPAHLADLPDVARERLNLLHGVFEPAGRRCLRHLVGGLAAGFALVVVVLAILAVQGRVSHLHAEAERVRQDTGRGIEKHLRELGLVENARLPPGQQLVQALRRYEQSGGEAPSAGGGQRVDLVAALDALWARWPREERWQVETVTAAPDRLLLRGRGRDTAAVQALTQNLGSFRAGGRAWRTGDPDINNQGEATGFLLTIRALDTGAEEAP